MIKNVLKTISAMCGILIYWTGYVTGFVVTLFVEGYDKGGGDNSDKTTLRMFRRACKS